MLGSGYVLNCVIGPRGGQRIELKPGLLCMGRGAEKETKYGWLLLCDPTVSRHHGDLHWLPEKQKFLYKHVSQTNPSRINGQLVYDELLLGNKSLLQIGKSCFILERKAVRLGKAALTNSSSTLDSELEKDLASYALQLLPNGFTDILAKEESTQIGIGARVLWWPEKKSFAVNSSPQATIYIERQKEDHGVKSKIQGPTLLCDGDILTVDFCQFRFRKLDSEIKSEAQIEEFASTNSPIQGYLFGEKIGQGSSGQVFLMKNQVGEAVAVKFLSAHLTDDPKAQARFDREGEIALKLRHPRVLRVYEVGQADNGSKFIASEYLPGGSLYDRSKEKRLWSGQEVAQIALDLGEALAYLHSQGLVHRDVKPSNIFFRQERAILADFGIVKSSDLFTATETGFTVGTPHYMSPEQFRGYTEPRSDQYSLATVIFELLSGRKLFDADEPIALAYMHVHQSPDSLASTRPDIAEEAAQCLQMMLAKQPSERFDTIEQACRKLALALASK